MLGAAVAALVAMPGIAFAQNAPVEFTAPGVVQGDPAGSDVVLDPSIATDGAGNWMAVWASNDGTAGDLDVYYSASTDNGVTWSAPAALNSNAGSDGANDESPSVATNGSVWVAVWSSDGTTVVSTNAGDGWSGETALGAGSNPAVAVGAAGDWVAVAADGGDISLSYSGGDSGSLDSGSDDGNPAIAADDSGNYVAAFEAGGDIGVAGSATGWDVSTVGTDGADAGPAVGYDGIGVWVVVWSADDGQVHMSVSDDSGASWSAATAIGGGADLSSAVTIATDGNGAWVAAWSSVAGELGGEGDIVFSGSEDNGITWTSAAAVVADAASDAGVDSNPDVASDGAGKWIAVWETGDVLSANFNRDILFATGVTTPATDVVDDDDSGPCFIASAAYGTPMAKDIEVLRSMRDSYLMNNAAGLFFVDMYYSISPVIADQVAQSPWLAGLVRALLTPVLFVVELFMRAPLPFLLIGIFGAAMIVRGVARRRTA